MAWIYEQKFNALNDGGLIGQDSFLQVSSHGDLTVQTSDKYEGAKAVITSSGSSGWMGEVYRDISSVVSGVVYFAIKQTGDIMNGGFFLYNAGTLICGVGSIYNQNFYLRATADTLLVENFSQSSWYLFALEFSTDSDQCRVKWKIAGGTWSAWSDWLAMTASSGIDRIRFGGYNDTGGTPGYLGVDCISPTNPEPETAISKVAGVEYSSLSKISGVAIASVKKVAGVA